MRYIDNGECMTSKFSFIRAELLALRGGGVSYEEISIMLELEHDMIEEPITIKQFVNNISRIEDKPRTLTDEKDKIEWMARKGETTFDISRVIAKNINKHVCSNQIELFILRNFPDIEPVIKANVRNKPRAKKVDSKGLLAMSWTKGVAA